MKMTERSAKWMETVLANCEANTGRTLPHWLAIAKKARVKDAREARAWAKEQDLSAVYQSAVVETLFPSGDVVGVRVGKEVDKELVRWLRMAYDRAVPSK